MVLQFERLEDFVRAGDRDRNASRSVGLSRVGAFLVLVALAGRAWVVNAQGSETCRNIGLEHCDGGPQRCAELSKVVKHCDSGTSSCPG